MSPPSWLDASELRIGLGCMRLSSADTIAAAVAAGITVFDTARAYEGSESLVAGALRDAGATGKARIVTKGGMRVTDGRWIPDGRAKTIRSDCEASLAALHGLEIDLYLIHAPDPRTPWQTSLRALARLVDEGVVRRVGVANVNRRQLDEALELAPIAAVEVALSPYDTRAVRGGVVERCDEAGIAVVAHSPLGGQRRAARLAREGLAEAALAWLLELSPAVVPIPGATRPETARSAARAATLKLTEAERAALGEARPAPRARRRRTDVDVVLVMGIPGAGKSRIADEYVAQGYVRLNRDERGGSLRDIAAALDKELSSGTTRVVLDNTYLTRDQRSYAVEAAARHGVTPRCIWLDTPLAQAQVNMVQRLLEGFGELPAPDELKKLARKEPGVLAPTSQMRALRELEPPSADEGFAAVEEIQFARAESAGRAGVFVAATALVAPDWAEGTDPVAPHLIFDWRPEGGDPIEIPPSITGPAEVAVCTHGSGPPTCWCRPPLPGLVLEFAHKHGVDASGSTLVGASAAHKTLATTLGAHYVSV